MWFHILTLYILTSVSAFGDEEHHRVIRQNELQTCLTPNNEAGYCISVEECPSVQELTRTREAEYLKKFICGLDTHYHKVCCKLPDSEPIPITGCGKSKMNILDKIVGGSEAKQGEFPWIAALFNHANGNSKFHCGGSLISNQWVITAAHCVENLGNSDLTVRVGVLNLKNTNFKDNAIPIEVPVDKIIPHPQYSESSHTNDIALVRLQNTITFTESINPICLLNEYDQKNNSFYIGKLAAIAGWGAFNFKGPTTSALKKAIIEIKDNKKCAQVYSKIKATVINKRVLCASSAGKDACQGDSGGPLVLFMDGRYYLGGVVSYGVECARDDYPGVYTKVAHFADWIKSNTGQ